jgi:hypothetical protein
MSEDYTLYKGDSIVGKVIKMDTSNPTPDQTKWQVDHPGGSFFYFGRFSGLQKQLGNMGYSI